jgi:hypothetical protein
MKLRGFLISYQMNRLPLAVVLFLSLSLPLYATDWYVDKNATGSNNGTSWTNAWTNTSSIAWASLSAGDTVFVSGGTYTGQLAPSGAKSGTKNNYIVITSAKYAYHSSGMAGHTGNVNLTGGIYINESGSNAPSYIKFKGFEVTGQNINMDVDYPAVSRGLYFESIYLHDYGSQFGFRVISYQDSLIVDSCIVIDCLDPSGSCGGERDCMHFNYDGNTYARNSIIRNCWMENRSQDPTAHNDVIQSATADGFIIYNNILISDSVYSTEGGGMPLILSSNDINQDHKPAVLIFNNFCYMGGIWYPNANYGKVLNTRHDGNSNVNYQSPTYIFSNTLVSNGPRNSIIEQEYHIDFLGNNILASFCLPDGTFGEDWRTGSAHGWHENLSANDSYSKHLYRDSTKSNLYWREDNNQNIFTGSFYTTGTSTASYANWNAWTSGGGTGVNQNPLFTNKFGHEPSQSALTGNITGSSPAIDAGEDLTYLANYLASTYNLPNDIKAAILKDKEGKNRGTAWDIGAYEFPTGGGGNNPPNVPSNPNPLNGATNEPVNRTLSWNCSDPNGDPLTYDIYFGTNSNPPIAATNLTIASYSPGQLTSNTTYYWKIVAKDNQGATTSGLVWSFSTINSDVTPPQVLSAALTNSTKLVINFSEVLNSSTAQNKNNYTITNGISVSSAVLSGTQVTLTTSAHVSVAYTVTVNNVTDLAGNVINPNYQTANYNYSSEDVTPPQVVSASLTSATTLVINFSEALNSTTAQNKNNYAINNGVSVTSAVLSSTQVTLITSAHVSGAYTVTVNNVTDLAGNVIDPQHKSALYEYQPNPELVKLTVSNVQASVVPEPTHTGAKTIDGKGFYNGDPDSRWAGDTMPEWLVYDLGAVRILKSTKLSFYQWDAGRTYNYTIQASTDSVNWIAVKTNVVSLAQEWTQETVTPTNARYIKIIYNSNNQNTWAGLWEAEFWGNNSGDVIPPQVVSAALTNSTKLVIIFSEALNSSTAQNKNNYIINNGIIVASAVLSGSQVTLTTSAHISGAYTVTINNVTDLAGNVVDPLHKTASFNYVTDITPPYFTRLTVTNSTTLTVNFSEKLDPVKAKNKINYSINKNIVINSSQLLPDSSSVLLKTSTHSRNTNYTLTISNITDRAGNVISPNPTSVIYRRPIKGSTSPILNPIVNTISNSWVQNYLPKKIIDGVGMNNPDSRWMSSTTMPDTLDFDMGNIYTLDSLRISFFQWDSDRLYKYSMFGSTDSLSWKPVVMNIWSDSLEWTNIEFDSTQTRFVKLVLLESNQSQPASIWEMELYGPAGMTNINNETEIPNSYSLFQNYPNPFNPTTTIKFDLANDGLITLEIFDILGRRIATLLEEYRTAGSYDQVFNASSLASGVYVYKLQAGDFISSKKMILLK